MSRSIASNMLSLFSLLLLIRSVVLTLLLRGSREWPSQIVSGETS